MPVKNRVAIDGSQRTMLPNAKVVGKVDPTERIEITVKVRRNPSGQKNRPHTDGAKMSTKLPEDRNYLTHEEFAAQYGADPDDLTKIGMFAHEHGLTVVESSASKRTVKLSGTVSQLTAAFGTNLKKYKVEKQTFRGRTGSIYMPKELSEVVEGVFGFDDRPAAEPSYRGSTRNKRFAYAITKNAKGKGSKKRVARPAKATPRNAKDGSLTALDVAALYNFPTGLNGKGQCIALIELNDPNDNNEVGTGFLASDIATYFKKLKIDPQPDIISIGVDGGANLPGINLDADGEVVLDIEVAGAVAPGATIAVYFAPNTDRGFIDVLSAAVHDTVHKPSVISISWGGPEDPPFSTKQFRDGMNDVLDDAQKLGITVCCASGDDGSSDLPLVDAQGKKVRDNKPHVDFPSASDLVLACGGTRLIGSGNTITSEVVWNDGDPKPNKPSGSTGGGASNFVAKPSYQSNVNVPLSPKKIKGRGVPDVAGNADPATGYQIVIGGRPDIFGGTSAVAPLWAGLIALINQRLANLGKKPVGFVNQILYNSANSFRDITTGNNDIDGKLKKYNAGQGWDPCTGLGTPDGTKVMKALGG